MTEGSNFRSNQNGVSKNPPLTIQKLQYIISTEYKPSEGEHAVEKRKGGVVVAYLSKVIGEPIKRSHLQWLNEVLLHFKHICVMEGMGTVVFFGQHLCMLYWKAASSKDVVVFFTAPHCSNMLKM